MVTRPDEGSGAAKLILLTSWLLRSSTSVALGRTPATSNLGGVGALFASVILSLLNVPLSFNKVGGGVTGGSVERIVTANPGPIVGLALPAGSVNNIV